MKTQKIALAFLVSLCVSFVTISCDKGGMYGNSYTTNGDIPDAQTVGTIVDLGVVVSDIRHMNVSLLDVPINIEGQSDEKSVANSQIILDLFTNSDGILNDGTYSFTEASEFSPFTFKSGTVLIPNSDTNSFDPFDIINGSVSLERSGTTYTINLDCTLSNGNTFKGSFTGILGYSDAETTY